MAKHRTGANYNEELNAWKRTRWLASVFVNMFRRKGQSVMTPEKLLPLASDKKERSGAPSQKTIERMKKKLGAVIPANKIKKVNKRNGNRR